MDRPHLRTPDAIVLSACHARLPDPDASGDASADVATHLSRAERAAHLRTTRAPATAPRPLCAFRGPSWDAKIDEIEEDVSKRVPS
jgi:hypothetical protein